MRRRWLLLSGLAAVAACTRAPAGPAPAARVATAELRDAQDLSRGSATLTARGPDSTRVTLRLTPPLTTPRGVHLHQVGRCDAPDFASAGAHLNPHHRQHGRRNPAGPHAGDLGNVSAALEFTVALPFDSLLDADGSAVIVHANTDDEMTDPSGNSGPRVLCGALQPASGRRTAP